jgi:hypothetical protein
MKTQLSHLRQVLKLVWQANPRYHVTAREN